MILTQEEIQRAQTLQCEEKHVAGHFDELRGYVVCAGCFTKFPCDYALLIEVCRRGAVYLQGARLQNVAGLCDECGAGPAPQGDTWDVEHQRDCSTGAFERVMVWPEDSTIPLLDANGVEVAAATVMAGEE